MAQHRQIRQGNIPSDQIIAFDLLLDIAVSPKLFQGELQSRLWSEYRNLADAVQFDFSPVNGTSATSTATRYRVTYSDSTAHGKQLSAPAIMRYIDKLEADIQESLQRDNLARIAAASPGYIDDEH